MKWYTSRLPKTRRKIKYLSVFLSFFIAPIIMKLSQEGIWQPLILLIILTILVGGIGGIKEATKENKYDDRDYFDDFCSFLYGGVLGIAVMGLLPSAFVMIPVITFAIFDEAENNIDVSV